MRELIERARENHREAYYIPCGIGGFDDVMHRLAIQCLTGPLLKQAQDFYSDALSKSATQSPPFQIESQPITSLIKSNAFHIECPPEIYQFDCRYLEAPGAWSRLRELTDGTSVIAGWYRRKVLALGTLQDIRAVFRQKIDGKITAVPISQDEFAFIDGVVIELFRQAIVRSLADTHGYDTDGKGVIWRKEPIPNKAHRLNEGVFNIHQAARLALRWYSGELFLVLEPTVRIVNSSGGEVPYELARRLRNAELSNQYNQVFSNQVNLWVKELLPKNQTDIAFPSNKETNFKFTVTRLPACATISSRRGRMIDVAQWQKSVMWEGTEFQEPELLFSNRDGTDIVLDTNPLRGIVRNQPYDYVQQSDMLGREISLGVITPQRDKTKVQNYLANLHHSIRPKSSIDYLLPYPGFAQAFGLPLDIPSLDASQWITCPEPNPGAGVKDGAQQLRRNIIRCIEQMQAMTPPHVIIIYVPERWAAWKRYDDEGETFDFHDFIKAYCVQKGIATQLIEESTLSDKYLGRVIWFQALAIYVKAMHTPWILDCIDKDTAFVGIGYSQSAKAPVGKHIVLGCSHIYNAEGVGLSYRLSQIEDPTFDDNDWRQRNPFMSADDARRVGESTRELFFRSGKGLPKRVVIHKRTPFREDEKVGLLQGLSGIPQIDMIELTSEPDLKFVTSVMEAGKLKPDNYPIKRGTAVRLNEQSVLLWVHGTTPAVTENRRFFLGSRRIPSPLLLTRHYGASNLAVLAREILGLSKMNWNNFEMYSKLPATIESSRAIARIGVLLERYGTALYDYRLFM